MITSVFGQDQAAATMCCGRSNGVLLLGLRGHCGVCGGADFLITNDRHFRILRSAGIRIWRSMSAFFQAAMHFV